MCYQAWLYLSDNGRLESFKPKGVTESNLEMENRKKADQFLEKLAFVGIHYFSFDFCDLPPVHLWKNRAINPIILLLRTISKRLDFASNVYYNEIWFIDKWRMGSFIHGARRFILLSGTSSWKIFKKQFNPSCWLNLGHENQWYPKAIITTRITLRRSRMTLLRFCELQIPPGATLWGLPGTL